jgi:hypothetical protein
MRSAMRSPLVIEVALHGATARDEDDAGPRRPTNQELGREAVEPAARVGRPVASCAETARIPGLPR